MFFNTCGNESSLITFCNFDHDVQSGISILRLYISSNETTVV